MNARLIKCWEQQLLHIYLVWNHLCPISRVGLGKDVYLDGELVLSSGMNNTYSFLMSYRINTYF
mgnify:CR=1 FL=1